MNRSINKYKSIFFCHIPKTGGTFLESLIEPCFEDRIFPMYGDRRSFITKSKKELDKYELYRGHLSFYFHKILPAPCYTFTILRDPVERVYSAWKHIKRDPSLKSHKYVVENNLSLADFLKTDASFIFKNLYTRFFGIHHTIRKLRSDYFKNPDDPSVQNEIKRLIGKRRGMIVSEKNYLFAVKQMETLDHIGFTDTLDNTVTVLKSQFNLDINHNLANSNKAPSTQNLLEDELELRETIIKENEFDIQLYNYFHKKHTSISQ